MPNFLIYRHGSNAANQGMCDKLPVAIVEAASPELAVEEESDPAPNLQSSPWLKLAPDVRRYVNQWFEAVPEAAADVDDWNAVLGDAEGR